MRTALFLVALSLATSSYAFSEFDVTILVGGVARPEYPRGDTVYIEALRGREYAIRLTNPTGYRVAVALSVDGLNTIDGQHTDARSAAKWVLDPYESTVISGWQVSDSAARRFFFTTEPRSYAGRRGETENLGIIEAVFYRERPRVVVFEGQTAPRGAAAPTAQSKAAAAEDYAATGMGDRTRHDVERVSIDLESRPVASVRLRYEYHEQLVRLGILVDNFCSTLSRRERAHGFSGYTPEQ